MRKAETIIVDLPPAPECPACGCTGLHFCTGSRDSKSVAYVGVRRQPKGKRHTR